MRSLKFFTFILSLLMSFSFPIAHANEPRECRSILEVVVGWFTPGSKHPEHFNRVEPRLPAEYASPESAPRTFAQVPVSVAAPTLTPEPAAAPVSAIAPPADAPARILKTDYKTMRPDDYLVHSAKKLNVFMNLLNLRHVDFSESIFALLLAALTKEPVLITGTGGNGKSHLASTVELIVDEDTGGPDFLARNFGPDTNKSDIAGPLSQVAFSQDEYKRISSASMANHYGVRIEELFDSSITVVRALHEIYDKRGRRLVLLISTTNKTVDQLMVLAEEQYGDRDLPRPTLSRFPIKIVVPRDFARARSYLHMFHQADDYHDELLKVKLSWQNLNALTEFSKNVQIPLHVEAFLVALTQQLAGPLLSQEINELTTYKQNKKLKGDPGPAPFTAASDGSKRSLMQSRRFLKAVTVLRNLKALEQRQGRQVIQSTIYDISQLKNLAPIFAADAQDREHLTKNEIDPFQQLQLQRAMDQIRAVDELYAEILKAANDEYTHLGFANEENIASYLNSNQNNVEQILTQLLSLLDQDLAAHEFGGQVVAHLKIATEVLASTNLKKTHKTLVEQIQTRVDAFATSSGFSALTP